MRRCALLLLLRPVPRSCCTAMRRLHRGSWACFHGPTAIVACHPTLHAVLTSAAACIVVTAKHGENTVPLARLSPMVRAMVAYAPQNAEASTRADTSSVEGLTQAPRLTGLMSHPGRSVPAVPNPLTALAGEDAKDSIRYRGPLWTPDRGAGFYQTQRERQQSPSLISTGRSASPAHLPHICAASHIRASSRCALSIPHPVSALS